MSTYRLVTATKVLKKRSGQAIFTRNSIRCINQKVSIICVQNLSMINFKTKEGWN